MIFLMLSYGSTKHKFWTLKISIDVFVYLLFPISIVHIILDLSVARISEVLLLGNSSFDDKKNLFLTYHNQIYPLN